MGPGLFCRRDISVPILLSRLRALFVALVVFFSVGRIGPSPPGSSDTDDTTEAGHPREDTRSANKEAGLG